MIWKGPLTEATGFHVELAISLWQGFSYHQPTVTRGGALHVTPISLPSALIQPATFAKTSPDLSFPICEAVGKVSREGITSE